MENENLFDIAFFLGKDFAVDQIAVIGILPKLMNGDRSKFMSALKNIIRNLTINYSLEATSKSLSLSRYLVESIAYKKDMNGICIICGFFYRKIRAHLYKDHNLKRHSMEAYEDKFANDSFFYLPLDFKFVNNTGKRLKRFRKRVNANNNSGSNSAHFTPFHDISREIIPYFSRCDNPDFVFCMECNKVIDREAQGRHFTEHRKSDPYQCPRCGKNFRKCKLRRHVVKCQE